MNEEILFLLLFTLLNGKCLNESSNFSKNRPLRENRTSFSLNTEARPNIYVQVSMNVREEKREIM